ncbi:MAG: ABC transporter substrate-binding protein [Syntrophobacterales bacterium]|nr:MAG: ABC transporter substrate-binding protein [Syntrophobacterales bacterium]
MKKILVTIGIVIFLSGALGGALAAGNEVKIGYLRLVMSLPTFVAVEKGFFTQEDLKVELVPFQSGTSIIDALVTGRIDANCGSAISGHWFAEQNISGRYKIFLGYGPVGLRDNTFVVVVRKDSPISDLKGLKRKKVGHFPGATSQALAKAVIRTHLDPEGVTLTEIPPPNMVPALAAGQIDAFFTPEPFGMMAVSKGVGRYLRKHPLTVLRMKRGFPGGDFSFSTKFLKKSPELAVKLKIAVEKAVDFIRENEKEARPYLVKYTGLPEPVAMRIPFDKWIKIKELDKGSGQDYFEVLYKEGAYKKRMDTTTLYYE